MWGWDEEQEINKRICVIQWGIRGSDINENHENSSNSLGNESDKSEKLELPEIVGSSDDEDQN